MSGEEALVSVICWVGGLSLWPGSFTWDTRATEQEEGLGSDPGTGLSESRDRGQALPGPNTGVLLCLWHFKG